MIQIKKTESDGDRFRFVSDFVSHAVERSDPMHGERAKRLFQLNLQQIINQEYAPAISSLRLSIRETQSTAAYLLLAEAYAQSGQTELALATLDVLRCVELDRAEAEIMKEFLLREHGDCAEAQIFPDNSAAADAPARRAEKISISK
jgi:Tfp pilus assembly protein PilF